MTTARDVIADFLYLHGRECYLEDAQKTAEDILAALLSDDEATYETARDNAERIGDLVEQLRRLGWEARPRPQYEALMAAQETLKQAYIDLAFHLPVYHPILKQIALQIKALRAAGIDLEDKT